MATVTQPSPISSQTETPQGQNDALRQNTGRSPGRMRVRWFVTVSIIAVLAIFLVIKASPLLTSQANPQAAVTATVRRANVPITITAGGELESSRGESVVCEVEGSQLKIVEMLPEGTEVTTGQVVIRLDPSDINDRLAAQQIKVTQLDAAAKAAAEDLKIQENLAASQQAQAELALQLASTREGRFHKYRRLDPRADNGARQSSPG